MVCLISLKLVSKCPATRKRLLVERNRFKFWTRAHEQDNGVPVTAGFVGIIRWACLKSGMANHLCNVFNWRRWADEESKINAAYSSSRDPTRYPQRSSGKQRKQRRHHVASGETSEKEKNCGWCGGETRHKRGN